MPGIRSWEGPTPAVGESVVRDSARSRGGALCGLWIEPISCMAEKTRRIFVLYCGLVLCFLVFSKIVLAALVG